MSRLSTTATIGRPEGPLVRGARAVSIFLFRIRLERSVSETAAKGEERQSFSRASRSGGERAARETISRSAAAVRIAAAAVDREGELRPPSSLALPMGLALCGHSSHHIVPERPPW